MMRYSRADAPNCSLLCQGKRGQAKGGLLASPQWASPTAGTMDERVFPDFTNTVLFQGL